MKNNNSNKIVSVLNFLTAFCFYICAIINFINDSGMGALYLCLGSTFLCLGSVGLNKGKKIKMISKFQYVEQLAHTKRQVRVNLSFFILCPVCC